ncbi:hypothetical protein [Tsukamurella strandjordii]|uniref:hypothetical protein n=1 Tax=Tsukamurella strandjordii TaxID=147577 RepID=UPI0031DE43B3
MAGGPIGLTQFQQGWSQRMMYDMAAGLYGPGVAADARALAAASAKQADSVAELERDAAALRSRWRGEAADESFEKVRHYTEGSYTTGATVANLVSRIDGLSETASTINRDFSTRRVIKELVSVSFDGGRLQVGRGEDESHTRKVAEELQRRYSRPIQSDATDMPSCPPEVAISFGGGDGGGTGPGRAPGPGGSGTTAGPGGSSSGGGTSSTGAGTTPGTTDGDDDGLGAGAADENGLGSSTDAAGGGPGSGQQSGAGAPSGTGTGADRTAGGTGLPDGTDGALTDTEPYDTSGQVSPLLSPAGVTPSGSTAGRGGLGTSGLRGGGGTTASPLGLRPDGASLRGTAPAAVAGASATTGARSSMPLGGVPAGAAGGQRGQGDGRHRTPGYLIDRANGEELVGGLPLVGPGVIGEWRADKAPEAPRPPVRGEPRRN